MNKDQLKQFAGQRYLTLETYCKDGTAVPTPMCFIVENGVIYLRTDRNRWKLKRIRNNPHVRVVPSDPAGKSKGEWVTGTAQPFGMGEMEWVYGRFKEKYRLEQKFVDLYIKLKKMHYIVIAVWLDNGHQENGGRAA